MIDDTEVQQRLRHSMQAIAQQATPPTSSCWHEPLASPVRRDRRLVAFVSAAVVVTVVAAALVWVIRPSTPPVTVSETTPSGPPHLRRSAHHKLPSPLTTPVPPTTTPRLSTTADPTAALARFLADHPDAVAHSTPVAYANNLKIAVVGMAPDPNHRAIDVLDLSTGTASPLATLTLPKPNYAFARGIPIQTADLTGDRLPDFLVRFLAADNAPGVVVSADSGTWKLVPQNADPTAVYIGRDPTISNGHLDSTRNDCMPTCAQGHSTLIVWHYDRQHNTMIPQ
jgi:hypothetical protein